MITKAKHPAKFSDQIVNKIHEVITGEAIQLGRAMWILDPFAGVGGVHRLHHETVGVEIEPEWAVYHPRTVVGDALHLPVRPKFFDAIVTSPCYGNRMADHHNAKDGSKRITYRHLLGRTLHQRNSGQLHWPGPEYKLFHQLAWKEALTALRPGGLVVCNVSNHIRQGQEQQVVEWHLHEWEQLGCRLLKEHKVLTPRHRFGRNHAARVNGEVVLVLRAP